MNDVRNDAAALCDGLAPKVRAVGYDSSADDIEYLAALCRGETTVDMIRQHCEHIMENSHLPVVTDLMTAVLHDLVESRKPDVWVVQISSYSKPPNTFEELGDWLHGAGDGCVDAEIINVKKQ